MNGLKTHFYCRETRESSSLPPLTLTAGMICRKLSTQWRRAAVVARTWRGGGGAMWLRSVLNYSSFSPSFCRHFSPNTHTHTPLTRSRLLLVRPPSSSHSLSPSLFFALNFTFSSSSPTDWGPFGKLCCVAVNRTIAVAAVAAAARVSSLPLPSSFTELLFPRLRWKN